MSTLLPLPVMSQIALPNFRGLRRTRSLYSGELTFGSWPQQLKFLAVDDALGAEAHHEIALVFFGDDGDGVGAGGRAKLDRERAEAAGRAPDQHVLRRASGVRVVAEQHAVGGCQRQRVAGASSQVRCLGRSISWRACTRQNWENDPSGSRSPRSAVRGEHRIAAVAFLVVAVVLVAVDDDLVADFPAGHLPRPRPRQCRMHRSRQCGRARLWPSKGRSARRATAQTPL
jgi:hypothetical protein